jgi:hypothetical protein
VNLCETQRNKCRKAITQKTQRKNITKDTKIFMRKMYNVKPFVKLCGSFVELGEIDIPQKTQRKNITKNTKKIYVENVVCGILCETL